jgi:O-antigen/teichoic acid export membrane protein
MSNKKHLLSNSLAILINRLTQSIATFVLTAAIARLAGAEALGQYLLAFSYYFIFVNIASQGLKTLFTRELAHRPEDTPIYLFSGSYLQFILAAIGYGLLCILVSVLPYNPSTKITSYIMGLTIIPFALSNVTESIFQAREKMFLIAYSTVPIYVLRTLAMIAVMLAGRGVNSIAALYALSETMILFLQYILIGRYVQPDWRFQIPFMLETLKKSWNFFVIEGVAVLSNRLEILVLSLLSSEVLLGFYGGIVQLFQPFWIISHSIGTAIFPALVTARDREKKQQKYIIEGFTEILLGIGLPFTVGLFFVGKELLIFIYHPSFAEASTALKLNALVLIILPFSRSLGNLLIANHLERINTREVIVTNFLGCLLGIFFVSRYQLLGAAMMDIAMAIIASSQYIYATYRYLFSLSLKRIFLRPLLLGLLMLITFSLLAEFQVNFLATLTIATFTYVLAAGLFVLNTFGGFGAIGAKWLKK